MAPRPLRLPTGKWQPHGTVDAIPGVQTYCYSKHVPDGLLYVLVDHTSDEGWHLSISFRDCDDRHTRYPSWDELVDARYALLPDGVTMAQLLPPFDQYVSLHPTTFHLYQIER